MDEFFMWLNEKYQKGDFDDEYLDQAIADKEWAVYWFLDCWLLNLEETAKLAQMELKRFKKHISLQKR